jgi:hypothetical protein
VGAVCCWPARLARRRFHANEASLPTGFSFNSAMPIAEPTTAFASREPGSRSGEPLAQMNRSLWSRHATHVSTSM